MQKISKLKEEAKACFLKKDYHSALGKYHHTLQLCREHKLHDEMAVIHANAAQVCLNLQLYEDAYKHADECLQINPDLDKVRGFRYHCTYCYVHVV